MSISERIRASGLTIYDAIPSGRRADLLIPAEKLELILESELIGNNYGGLPLRTRSKAVNQDICRALGYPVPASFKKTKPRFLGQNFDKYVQKANNLQIWNEELDPTRRYVVIRVGYDGIVKRVRVITGTELGFLDTTGTLTQKYQAQLKPTDNIRTELISKNDTDYLRAVFKKEHRPSHDLACPTDRPIIKNLLEIAKIYDLLTPLVGEEFDDAGFDQERNRGEFLHRLVCQRLGYSEFADNGRFPDLRNQLLEVKLQTSPTIDLGLVLPSCEEFLDGIEIAGLPVRHCDVRYALFYGKIKDGRVRIYHFYLTTGQNFFARFPQFQGKVLNKKLQIPLPSNFFDR